MQCSVCDWRNRISMYDDESSNANVAVYIVYSLVAFNENLYKDDRANIGIVSPDGYSHLVVKLTFLSVMILYQTAKLYNYFCNGALESNCQTFVAKQIEERRVQLIWLYSMHKFAQIPFLYLNGSMDVSLVPIRLPTLFNVALETGYLYGCNQEYNTLDAGAMHLQLSIFCC